jgi:hypothetical protein
MNTIRYDGWCVHGNIKRELPRHEKRGIFLQMTLSHEIFFDGFFIIKQKKINNKNKIKLKHE